MKKIALLLFSIFCLSSVQSQTRYVDQVFDGVTLAQDEIYGANVTVITLLQGLPPTLQPLNMDFYEPTGDSLAARPLVLLFKTGNFLPQVINGSIYGTIRDSALVEVANRLAKMGYAVASVNYREGWNPFQETQPARALQLIQAAYRGVQDARTAVKFFKRSAVEFGNPYRIDTSKIVLWGMGTGGYVSLATGYLSDYFDIITTTNPVGKFLTELDTSNPGPEPMVIEAINGDLNVDSYGIVPPPGLLVFAAGDTLSVPNHPGYKFSADLVVQMGGALGDISWMDAGDPPVISFHVPLDNNAPYTDDVLTVPTTGDPIVQVQGGFAVVQKAHELGLNDVFAGIDDPITEAARAASAAAGHDYMEGLYPINIAPHDTAGRVDGSPWNWWDMAFWSQSAPGECGDLPLEMCNWNLITLQGAPFTSAARARAYIDTAIAYFAPRAVAALGLDEISSVNQLSDQDVNLLMAPNPVADFLRITVDAQNPIRSASLYNTTGQELGRWNQINYHQMEIQRTTLAAGTYFIQLRFDGGIISKKVVFK